MTPTHLIRLLPEGGAEWLALGRDGRILSGPQSGLPGTPAERTWVLVPAEAVLLLRAPRVARARRQLEQAVPFAIEDQLAAPIELSHVALDESAQGEDLGVAVVSHAAMEAWLAPLHAAGIAPDRMLPDGALLSVEGATVFVEGRRALLRYAPAGLFAGNVEEIPDWLALLAAAGHPPPRLRWIGPAAAVPVGLAVEREDADVPLRWFAARLAQSDAPNLLQGRYAPRRGREGARRVWRWAALLALAAALAGIAQLALERRQLEARHVAQRAEMESLLRSAVPGISRIVDPRAQLAAEQARVGRGGGGGLLPLLARIAPSLSGSGRYTLDGLEFRGDTLELVVRAPDVATLDGLREVLAAMALQVELTGATPGSGGVEGRLRIRGGGA
jgi:general secretion pathway protein L